MPKLLQVNLTINALSTGKIAEQIGRAAIAEGWDSYIAYGIDCYSNGQKTSEFSESVPIKIGNKIDRLVHRIINRIMLADGKGSYIATKKFINEVNNIRPDVIHLHNIYNSYINIPILFDFLADYGRPIVWTIHDCRAFTGACSHFIYVGCEKWKVKCNNCPQVYCRFQRNIPGYNYDQRCKLYTSVPNLTVVGVSHWLESLLNKSYLKNAKVCCIQNGIDTNCFRPSPSTLRTELGLDGKFVILGVSAAWNDKKGLKDYIELSKFLPDDYKIVLLGMSQNQIERLPAGIIGLLHTKNQRQLAEFYTMADVIASLSYGETFGMTPIEAMACGTPAIVYDNTAQPELITEETGLVVTTGSVDQLRAALEYMKKVGKDYYSDSCIRHAEVYFDSKIMYKNYLDLYKSILF